MASIQFLSSLHEIADHYDALLCDAWGVIHNGVDLFDGAGEAMAKFRETRGPVIILTNAPRPSSIIPAQLERIGLACDAWDDIVTSGDATRAEIEKMAPARAFRIGPEKDDALYEDLNVNFSGADDAEFVVCTGLRNDQAENPEAYADLLGGLAERKLPMICANPDIVVNWGGRIIWCAGALAEIYERLGGEVIYGGKPHKPIYDLACKKIDALRREATSPSRILAIGDGVKTDILGANAHGHDAVFVAGDGGVHQGDDTIEAIAHHLAEGGASAVAAMKALKW